MLLAFELSMPGVNSWNGRWSGEQKPHVKVLNVGAKCLAKPGRYGYDFGDGWRASVTVREVDGKTARKLRRESAGFCGYDWMCDEIRFDGRIKTLAERTAARMPNQRMSGPAVAERGKS
jgi:hypothetical protein